MLLRDWLGLWSIRIRQRRTLKGSSLVMNAWLTSPKILRVFGCSEHLKKNGTKTVFMGSPRGQEYVGEILF